MEEETTESVAVAITKVSTLEKVTLWEQSVTVILVKKPLSTVEQVEVGFGGIVLIHKSLSAVTVPVSLQIENSNRLLEVGAGEGNESVILAMSVEFCIGKDSAKLLGACIWWSVDPFSWRCLRFRW